MREGCYERRKELFWEKIRENCVIYEGRMLLKRDRWYYCGGKGATGDLKECVIEERRVLLMREGCYIGGKIADEKGRRWREKERRGWGYLCFSDRGHTDMTGEENRKRVTVNLFISWSLASKRGEWGMKRRCKTEKAEIRRWNTDWSRKEEKKRGKELWTIYSIPENYLAKEEKKPWNGDERREKRRQRQWRTEKTKRRREKSYRIVIQFLTDDQASGETGPWNSDEQRQKRRRKSETAMNSRKPPKEAALKQQSTTPKSRDREIKHLFIAKNPIKGRRRSNQDSHPHSTAIQLLAHNQVKAGEGGNGRWIHNSSAIGIMKPAMKGGKRLRRKAGMKQCDEGGKNKKRRREDGGYDETMKAGGENVGGGTVRAKVGQKGVGKARDKKAREKGGVRMNERTTKAEERRRE